jgi:putative endonuclease
LSFLRRQESIRVFNLLVKYLIFCSLFLIFRLICSAAKGWNRCCDYMYKTIHQYYLYILSNHKNGTLYIGVTNDLERRMFEHKNKLIEGFTKQYGLNKLIYFETYQYVNDAIEREKNMKKWKRQWKIDLIEKENREWNDLSSDWTFLIE